MMRTTAKAAVARRGVWRSELFAVVALLAFVGIVVAIDITFQPILQGSALLLLGLLLAVVPALLWLTFFYLQDRLEPEPIGHVARQFLIGAALAGAFGLPLLAQAFTVQDWLYRDTTTQIVGGLLIATIETFVIYATVRYFIYDSPEFDERTDGVVYGTAAGLGLATASNLQFILANGGGALGAGEVYVAEVALAHAAFGGLLGYFFGRAKMEREPVWWLATGFGLTVILNLLFTLLRGQFETGSFGFGTQSQLPSLTGLMLAGGLAVIVTVIVSALVGRDIARSQRGEAPPPAADAHIGDRQSNQAVLVLLVILLLVGIVGWNSAINGTTSFRASGLQGNYPASYSEATADGELLRVSNTLGSGTSFVVRSLPLDGGDAKRIATLLAGEVGTDAAFYRVTESEQRQVAGNTALRQRFAYVDSGAFVGATPQVIEGIHYIIIRGEQAFVATLIAGSDAINQAEPAFEQFVASLQFS
jgi:protease PrsW